MLIALTLASVLAAQVNPPPGPSPEIRRDVHVITMGGGGGSPDLDKNDDGFVTREEFIAPQTAAFEILDANDDGRVSTEEFLSGRAAAHVILGGAGGHVGPPPGAMPFPMPRPGAMGGGNMMMFRHGGPGGPGELAGPGTDIRIHRVGGPGGSDGPGGLDKDGDGKVSEAEFLAPLRDAFQQMDADHSGSLEDGEHGPGGGNVVIMRRGGPDAPSAD